MSFFDMLYQMLSYTFMQRALIVGVLIALCSSLLGVSLVLKRYSMIGDGLSHVGFGTLAVASALNLAAPLELAIPVVIAAAFFLLKLSENSKIKGDSAIAILSSSAMAIGIVVTSVSTGLNADIENYLFGSILAMSQQDMIMCIILAVVVIGMFILFYNRIFAVTFDENFAKAVGTNVKGFNLLIAIIIAVIIVLAMNLVGSLLVSALIIFPAISAMRIFKSFLSVTIFSAVLSVLCALTGICVSIFYGTPVGATIVAIDIAMFFVCFGIGKIRG